MDEEVIYECPPSQIASSICECACQIEETENPESIEILTKTMRALLFLIDIPRGEVKEMKRGT